MVGADWPGARLGWSVSRLVTVGLWRLAGRSVGLICAGWSELVGIGLLAGWFWLVAWSVGSDWSVGAAAGWLHGVRWGRLGPGFAWSVGWRVDWLAGYWIRCLGAGFVGCFGLFGWSVSGR